MYIAITPGRVSIAITGTTGILTTELITIHSLMVSDIRRMDQDLIPTMEVPSPTLTPLVSVGMEVLIVGEHFLLLTIVLQPSQEAQPITIRVMRTEETMPLVPTTMVLVQTDQLERHVETLEYLAVT